MKTDGEVVETNTEITDDELLDDELLDDEMDVAILEIENLPSFDKELKTFIAHITSLSATLQISMKAINDAFVRNLEKLDEFEKENITYQDINGKKAMLVKSADAQEFQDLNKQLRAYSLAFKTIPRSYVMALISQYDAFLGRLLRVVFLTKPEMFNSSERNITFSQLVEFGSVEDAKEFILEKEVESVLRKSHTEQFQWMESKFDMPLRKGLDIWSQFVEVTERRNLFVHTGGIISSQYLKVCKEHGVDLGNSKNGGELGVSKEYFEQAYNVIFEIGFKLAHVLWRKFKPDELEASDDNIISIGYDTLHEEDYPLTKMIFDFATQTIKKHCREESRCVMVVNRALAYKWGGEDKKAKSIISQEDWSATMARFRLAEAILLDNFEDAYEVMREIGKNHKEIAKEDYRDWPLFKAIKAETKFLEVFQEIFGEPYNKIEQKDSELPKKISSNELAGASNLEKPLPG